jgi:hypothetical protein
MLRVNAYFTVRNKGGVFQHEISTLWINSGHFDCHALYFKLFSHVSIMRFCIVNTAVSCQLYSSTNLHSNMFPKYLF